GRWPNRHGAAISSSVCLLGSGGRSLASGRALCHALGGRDSDPRPHRPPRTMPMRKLTPLAVIVAGGLAVALAVPDWAPAQKGPIKIGFLIPETGPLAANGKDMANGFQLFFEEQGWKLAGREVKLITEDDEGKPPTGLAKARS